ncbi:MAG: hypothetical protein GWP91_09965 [Rhodobacterales bacterium]|nr:hypothetical protein [Rhodobacterales bacterium]
MVSSTDEQNWRFEGRFFEGTDIREPQLVSWNGTLHLYFALLGTDPAAFEPQGSRHTVYSGPGDWSPPEVMFDADFIPWRIKEVGGRLSVTGYTGGGGVYDPDGDPVRVRWLGSDDGLSWSPYIDGVEVLHEGGASESDLVVRDDGSVVAVIRNEGGDTGGFGSKICRGAPDSPGDWTCANDPKKYDSPLVFEEAGRVWLIGRRHLTDDGHYDLGRTDLSPTDQYWLYQLSYWGEPKRCSLWEIDPDALTATWTLDLPSKGDTCFTERVRLGEKLLVYNYSSDPDGPELSWVEGQGDPTGIWRQELDFTP